MTKHQRGNVFLYILIAIVLFAGLTMILTRTQQSNEMAIIGDATKQTKAQRLMSYTNQASQSWAQMKSTGTDLGELSLMLPTDGGFNSGTAYHRLFHPDGGGLIYNDMNTDDFRAAATTPVGWHFVLVNADWTATSGTDLIMTYVRLQQDLCAEINRTITGSTTIPTVTVNFTSTFVDGSSPLLEAECAECKTYPAICVGNGGVYAFYNMLGAR